MASGSWRTRCDARLPHLFANPHPLLLLLTRCSLFSFCDPQLETLRDSGTVGVHLGMSPRNIRAYRYNPVILAMPTSPYAATAGSTGFIRS